MRGSRRSAVSQTRRCATRGFRRSLNMVRERSVRFGCPQCQMPWWQTSSDPAGQAIASCAVKFW